MGYGSGMTYSGDWKALDKFLRYSWHNELEEEVNKATKRSALYILSNIRQRIHDKEYTANALPTAIAKGFKTAEEATPLVASGTLIKRALAYIRKGELAWEVGVVKDVKTKNGKATMKQIIPILHEGGTITVKRGDTTVIIRIPPRPFLKDVFDDPTVIKYVHKQWDMAVEKVLKKHGKL